MSIPVRPFWIFSKIRGYIRGSRCTTVVNDTGGKWKKSSSRKILIILFGHLWVVELAFINIFAFRITLRYLQPDFVPILCHRYQRHRWQKFSAGIVDTGGKFSAGVNNTRVTGSKICHRCHWHRVIDTGSLTPVVHIYLRISPRIFEKIRNDPNVIFRGLGEGGSWNKLEAKNLVTLSL